jgi:HNH endonuclease
MVTLATEQIAVADNKRYYRKSNQGYWLVWNKDHPKAYSGRVLEQVIVFEEHNKCCMLRWGIVHHINEVKTDNRIENLQGMTRRQHINLHMANKRIPDSRKCCRCGSNKTSVGSDGVAKWSVVDRSKALFHCSNCDNHERRKK